MQEIFVGWDGGGTGTHLVCLDADGTTIARQRFGPLNPNGADDEAVRTTVADCVRYMNRIGQCASLCIGAAGVSNPRVAKMLTELLSQQGIKTPPLLKGDHEIALVGAVGACGVILIAGTGSVCYGQDEYGHVARSGGYGHLLSDEGSGYAIGRDILSAVLRASDGRGCATLLEGEVAKRIGSAASSDLVAYAYHPKHTKADIAALAPLLEPAVRAGDAAALAIATRAAEELFLLAQAVLTQLPTTIELSFLGSVLTHCEPVKQKTTTLLCERFPQLSIIPPREDAAYGAAWLALHQS